MQRKFLKKRDTAYLIYLASDRITTHQEENKIDEELLKQSVSV